MNNLIEKLTHQFYGWEQRGRGKLMFDVPVQLEPVYAPFYRDITPTTSHDDGRKHTLYTWIRDWMTGRKPTVKLVPTEEMHFAFPYESDEPLVAFRAILPKERETTLAQTEKLLINLSETHNPVSFEIIASRETIVLQWVVRERDARFVYGQLQTFFPDLAFLPVDTPEEPLHADTESYIVDLGLEQEFMLPIATYKDLGIDSLTGLFGIFENLQGDERAALQILLQGATSSWSKSVMASVTDYDGTSFFLDAPKLPKYAQQKVSLPLFGVCVRVMAQSQNKFCTRSIAEDLAYTMCNISASPINSLCPLSNERYQTGEHYADVLNRESRRLGMLLNSAELTQLLHIPKETVPSRKFEEQRKSKSAPQLGAGIRLGVNVHQGIKRGVTVPNTHRMKHTHIIGATGTGKSTLLLNLITEDIQSGNGLAVLDPHGDLIDAVLSRIPEHRYKDVIIIDPSDSQYSVGFNILSAHSDIEKDILASDLVSVFRRLSTSWGDQMNSVLANAILAFLESKEGGTLLDLRHFLLDKSFRENVLKGVADPHITYYWRREYPLLKSSSVGSILTRLDGFLRPKAIRNIVGQKRSLNFEDIMDNKKILLIKLSQGLIGTENSYLLGSLFVTKIYQTTLTRQAKGETLRNDFFLYVDEFQNFVTPSLANILSGARKYRLGLVLAHQDMQQLTHQDAELSNSVLSNCGTRICFRLGDSDAKKFEEGFSYFNASDIQNLAVGEAIARFNGSNSDFNLSVTQPLALEEINAKHNRETIIDSSHKKYGTLITDLVFSTPLGTSPEPEQEKAKPKEKPPKTERKVEEECLSVTVEEQPTVSKDKEQQLVDDLVRRKEVSRHRYLQTLIKRMAEAKGFIAQIEAPTPDGKGRVDVSLEKNGKKIACEVGITTTKEWEIHNIGKCLNAGYDLVIACSDEQKALGAMQRKIAEVLDTSQQTKVITFLPEDLFAFLEMEAAKDHQPEDKRMKGYRIKTEHTTISTKENQRKRESVIKTIVDAFRKE